MKRLLTVLGLAALLTGCCCPHESGMGGTSDDTMMASASFHNNAVNGTGSNMEPNGAMFRTP